jgi:hypothetical protein
MKINSYIASGTSTPGEMRMITHFQIYKNLFFNPPDWIFGVLIAVLPFIFDISRSYFSIVNSIIITIILDIGSYLLLIFLLIMFDRIKRQWNARNFNTGG